MRSSRRPCTFMSTEWVRLRDPLRRHYVRMLVKRGGGHLIEVETPIGMLLIPAVDLELADPPPEHKADQKQP